MFDIHNLSATFAEKKILKGISLAMGAAFACAIATPGQSEEVPSSDLALRRLRACVTSGASGAPRNDLRAAVVAVRALCRPQIDTAYKASDRNIDAVTPAAEDENREARKSEARRQIDHDLAVLIAKITGAQL